MPVSTPPVIPEPFAASGDRAAIPDTTVTAGRASYALGFPPITMQAKVAGGIPPDGRDVNGILYVASAHAYFTQAGQVFTYSSAVSTAIGGYGVGALLQSTDGETLWLNQTNGNTSNPDTGGAGWVPYITYGAVSITGLVGGTRVLTANEARFTLIVLNGALAANQAVILPAQIRQWRIVNLCTGSFTVTVRTASGSGVTAPAGGFAASTPVYGDGTNIYFDVPPVSIPTDVAPSANTLLMRNNVGDGFVRYLNMSSGLENFTPDAVFAQAGGDGYLRKLTYATFVSQVLANANLTGTALCPTPAVGNNTTRVANTTYVQNSMVGGAGESWQDLTAIRALDTSYTNTTGRPIAVNVSVSITASGQCHMFVDGVRVAYAGAGANSSAHTLPAIVPAGSTYRVNTAVSGSSLVVWSELR